MRKRKQRLFLSVGLLLYVFDLGSDIYVALKYWENYETWWFWLTCGFICVPSLIVNFTAIFQFRNPWSFIAAFAQLSIVARYIDALKKPDSRIGNFYRTHLLAILRYIETITKSAPQWCLQVYIMLRQWSFPSYTVVSTVLSMMSLVWSITILEKERREDNDKEFTLTNALLFGMWQMSTLISRLSAIVLFAYVFPRYYVIIFLAGHWLILVVTIFLIEMRNGGSFGKSLLLSILAACSSLFHSAENDLHTKRPMTEMIVGYLLLILMSFVMLVMSLIRTTNTIDVAYMDVLMPIGIVSVLSGSILSMLLAILLVF